MIAYTPKDIRALARLVKITIFLFLQKSVVFEKNSLYNFSITTSKKSAIFYIIYIGTILEHIPFCLKKRIYKIFSECKIAIFLYALYLYNDVI